MGGLYGTAMKWTRNPVQAEDLVAQTYANAWRAFDRFERGTNIRAWLYRILHNLYVSEIRKNAGRPTDSLDAEDAETGQSLYEKIHAEGRAAGDPEKIVLDRLDAEAVSAAVDRLPEPYKSAVILCDLQGLSYEEGAEALEVPVGTVRSRLHRGRAMLQTALWGIARDNGWVSGEKPALREAAR